MVSSFLNDAVYKFKRYEDASLSYTGVDRHAGENVGLYSTVVSRTDYDAMAGLLADSMRVDGQPTTDEAEKREEQSIPAGQQQHPVVPEQQKWPASAEAERANTLAMNKAIKSVLIGTGETELAIKVSVTAAQQSSLQPTYRPAFIPPKSVAPKPPEKKEVDVSGVKVGTVVKHKAFGEGTVCRMETTILWVSFTGEEKRFAFPSAFQDGFLMIE